MMLLLVTLSHKKYYNPLAGRDYCQGSTAERPSGKQEEAWDQS